MLAEFCIMDNKQAKKSPNTKETIKTKIDLKHDSIKPSSAQKETKKLSSGNLIHKLDSKASKELNNIKHDVKGSKDKDFKPDQKLTPDNKDKDRRKSLLADDKKRKGLESSASGKKISDKSAKENSLQPPEGYYYDENHELVPVFIKKLAINKNAETAYSDIKAPQNHVEAGSSRSNKMQSDSIGLEEKIDSIPEPIKDVKILIKKNREWLKTTLEAQPEFLNKIASPQNPKFLVISCSDSIIQTSSILGTEPGELFVHMNIGNIVMTADFNIQSVISYAVENLKVKNIIVLGHTDCGAIKASLSNKYHGLIDNWLKPVKDVVERNHDYLDKVIKESPEKLTTTLTELNIKEQVINLCKNPIIQKAWNKGQEVYIHGLLFDTADGHVRDLGIMKKDWKKIADAHTLEFA